MSKISESLKSTLPIATDFYIEIFDRKEIVLTGDVEVTELEKTVLKIKSNEHGAAFFGEDIKVISYNADGIRINGKFEKIEFY